TSFSASTIQSTVMSAWDQTLAMPCTTWDTSVSPAVCTEAVYDPTYTTVITVENGSYNLTDSGTSTNYPLKFQGSAVASIGCGPTCTCPSGQPSCDLSSVTGCAERCYVRTNRDVEVPAKIQMKPLTAGTKPSFTISGGSYAMIVGGPDSKSSVQATVEDFQIAGLTTIVGISVAYTADATVKRSKFKSLKSGIEMSTVAATSATFKSVDNSFTKCVFALSNMKAGTIARIQSENGYGNITWGNTRGCLNWGSGHFTMEAPFQCYLQGGSATAYSSATMGVYTALQAGEGGINVSTATLDPSTGAITNQGTPTEGLDPDTGQPFFQVMGTGSFSGTQYLFQYGLFADKTVFIALRNVAISNLGTGICQNMVTGTSSTRRVTLANTKITNYKTMYYKGTGNAYCVSPDLTVSPQLANVNATATASPIMFNPSSGICLTSDWKAPSAMTPNYQTPVRPNPYPSDTSGLYNAPGMTCASSAECANSASCCPATGTQTCGTSGSTDAVSNGICMCVAVNQPCSADTQCCAGYCHPTYSQCVCASATSACTSNSQCCSNSCTSNVCD
ncbi:MAG: hypothetical protein ACKOCK_09355, partial [Chloroflexota bacterium]